jgi:hypothetical protein
VSTFETSVFLNPLIKFLKKSFGPLELAKDSLKPANKLLKSTILYFLLKETFFRLSF